MSARSNAGRPDTLSGMTKYLVRLADGSEKEIEARRHEYNEHGVVFSGTKHQQGAPAFVAFVPYANLLLITAVK